MSDMIEILEHELESAVQVKDRGALHRYMTLLVERVVGRREYERGESSVRSDIGALRSDVAVIAERMEQGFARMDERFAAMDKRFEDLTHQMDKRFEAVDKRFEDMNRRFSMLVALSTAFFVVLATMMTVLRLFG